MNQLFCDTPVLVTGDATALSEAEMLSYGQKVDADILVLGHHGSDGSTSETFLKKVSPDMAIISCGLDNVYLHPSQRVMELLEKEQIPVYRVDSREIWNLSLMVKTSGVRKMPAVIIPMELPLKYQMKRKVPRRGRRCMRLPKSIYEVGKAQIQRSSGDFLRGKRCCIRHGR